MTEHLCVVCPQLRRGDPRIYERANVCDGCRSRLRALLREVETNYAALRLAKGSANDGAKVSGSRTPPLPLVVNALDLTMPPHTRGVQDDLVPLYERVQVEVEVYEPTSPAMVLVKYPTRTEMLSHRRRRRDENGWLAYGPSGDQVGEPSVPAMLDSWARDWQTHRWRVLPLPTVPMLAEWLLQGLEWVCDEHPAIDDFAHELSETAAAIRPHGPRAELKVGVPCRECEVLALFCWPGSDYVECGACPSLLTPEEYARWTQLIASKEHQAWVREVVQRQRESAPP